MSGDERRSLDEYRKATSLRDILQACGALFAIIILTIGSYVAWGSGYSMIILAIVILAAIMRARMWP